MDRNQVRMALLKIALLTLVGTSWVFTSFVFATRPDEVDPDALTALVRLPASLPTQLPEALPAVFAPAVRVNEPIEMGEVKVLCWDGADESEQETSMRWIRLTGRPCATGSVGAEGVSVRNLTNGYSATVFPTQTKSLTTDFIPLVAGKNNILIRFEQGPGVASEQQFSFFRE